MPIHGHVLSLIGWRLSRAGSELIVSEPDRLEQMRGGHAELVRTTGRDFGYDVAQWREFLLSHDGTYRYSHPYAFASVEWAIKAAIADADYSRLAELAMIGGREWDARYTEKLARERQAHLDAIAAADAIITKIACPFCGKPCPSYRITCKHCGKRVRECRS